MEFAEAIEMPTFSKTTRESNRAVVRRECDPQDGNLTLCLEDDWFRVLSIRNKKPKPSSVQKYWAVLRKPWNDSDAMYTLFLAKRALLEWPEMGAAIARLAQKELLDLKVISSVHRRKNYRTRINVLRCPERIEKNNIVKIGRNKKRVPR